MIYNLNCFLLKGWSGVYPGLSPGEHSLSHAGKVPRLCFLRTFAGGIEFHRKGRSLNKPSAGEDGLTMGISPAGRAARVWLYLTGQDGLRFSHPVAPAGVPRDG